MCGKIYVRVSVNSAQRKLRFIDDKDYRCKI